MKHAYIYAALVLASTVPVIAQQQERTYTWTLTQDDMLYLGGLLDAKIKEPDGQLAAALARRLQVQINQQNQAAQQGQQQDAISGIEKRLRDKLAAEAKAKADADEAAQKAKDDAAKAAAAPPPEDKHDP